MTIMLFTELWLDRIRYDYMCGHGLLADSIYNQSLTILDEEFKDTMETCFNKFKESFTYVIYIKYPFLELRGVVGGRIISFFSFHCNVPLLI